MRTEEQGFYGMWLGSAFGFDPFIAMALAGQATTTIQLGIAVVPTWPRHPIVMAQQAASASAACGGRFRLGIGPSHAPVMGMYGIDFDRPISHLREYLGDRARRCSPTARVAHEGERYRVNAFPRRGRRARAAGDARRPARAGRRAWPVVTPTARSAGSARRSTWRRSSPRTSPPARPRPSAPTPPLIAELPCALSTDRDAVHAMAARDLAVYPHMPFYRAIFEAAGIEMTGREWNDEMIDASVLYGDEDGLAAKIQAFFDAGADEVVLSPFGVGDDPASSQAECIRVLERPGEELTT